MHFAGNFHPEWGYLVPAPGFVHTARIVMVAALVGATAGAGLVVSLGGRPGEIGDLSVAARTLARPVDSASSPVGAPQRAQANKQAAIRNQPTKPSTPDGDGGFAATSELSASSTGQPPVVSTALGEEPPATDASPAQIPTPKTAADSAPIRKKITKKHQFASRYTPGGDNARSPYVAYAPAGEYGRWGRY
jgi:hypothetical protein